MSSCLSSVPVSSPTLIIWMTMPGNKPVSPSGLASPSPRSMRSLAGTSARVKTRLSVLSIAADIESAIGMPACTMALRIRQKRSITAARTTSRMAGIRSESLFRLRRPGSERA